MKQILLFFAFALSASYVYSQTAKPIAVEKELAFSFSSLDSLISPLQINSGHLSRSSQVAVSGFLQNVSIIGLGEVTHGTSEAYTTRHDICEYLIRNKGFNMICLENSYGWTEALNEYILTGNGNPDQLMRENLLGIWQNQEMRAFLEWLKNYNMSTERKVSLKGMDYSQLSPNATLIKKDLEITGDQVLTTSADSLYSFFSFIDSGYHSLNKPGSQPDMKRIVGSFINGYEVITRIQDRVQKYQSKIPVIKWQQLVESLENSRLACYSFYRAQKLHQPEISRDSIMAAMVKIFKNNDTTIRVIIWAHNAHIAKKAIYGEGNGGGMGGYISREFPGSYFAIGMGTAKGTYAATNERFVTEESEFHPVKFDRPLRESWETLLSGNQNDCLYIDLSKININLPSLDHRFIGHVAVKNKEPYQKVKLDELYDGFLFLRETRAASSFR